MLKRILSVLGANVFGQACTIVIQLVGAPLFLYFWGTDLYGEWLIISALPTYFAVSGTGISLVSGNKMQMLVAEGNERQANIVFQSSWLLVSLLSLFIFSLALPFVAFNPIYSWLGVDSLSGTDVKWILTLLCVHVLLMLQTDLFTGVYRANNIYARGISIQNTLRLMEFVAIAIFLAVGVPIAFVASAYLLVRVLGIIWMLFDLRKINWVKLSFRHASWKEAKSQIYPIVSYLGIPLSQAFLLQGMTTVIGLRLGSAAVVGFSVTRTLVNFVKQFASVLHYAVLPEFSTNIKTGDLETARRLHRYAFQITLWFVVSCALVLNIFSDWIFKIWMSGQVKIDDWFFFAMSITVILASLTGVSYFVPASINKFSAISVITLVVAIGCTMLAYVTMPDLGLYAVPFALLVNEIIMFKVVVSRSLSIVHDNFPSFLRSVLFTVPIRNFGNAFKILRSKASA